MLDFTGKEITDDTKVFNCDLLGRYCKPLILEDIVTVGQLMALSERQIRSIRGIGKKSLGAIIKFKEAYVSDPKQHLIEPRPGFYEEERLIRTIEKSYTDKLEKIQRQIDYDKKDIKGLYHKMASLQEEFYVARNSIRSSFPEVIDAYNSVTQHSIGVQNVYDKFVEIESRQKEIEDLLKSDKISDLMSMIRKLGAMFSGVSSKLKD